MYASINFVLVASSVAQSGWTAEMPGSIHSGESCARGAYMACGYFGPTSTGCKASGPVFRGTSEPTRKRIVSAGLRRSCSCARAGASAACPPKGGASGVAAGAVFR